MVKCNALVVAAVVTVPLAAAPRRALADEQVHVIVNIDVLPSRAAEGKAVLMQEGQLSRQDAGFVAWQLLQRTDHENHFAIVEVWSGEANFDRHVESEHAKAARSRLQPILASPFDEREFKLLE